MQHGNAGSKDGADDASFCMRPPVRCNTCESETQRELLSSSEDQSLVLKGEQLQEKLKASRLQLLWDRTMCDELKIPRGYVEVHVLLIQWEVNDWPEATAKEINALKVLFGDRFNFRVQCCQIPDSSACVCASKCIGPQAHLDNAICDFFGGIKNNDNTLAILYYTGHGHYEPTLKHLELSGCMHTPSHTPPKLVWNHSEQKFAENPRCDILAIMDCCMAAGLSGIVQGEEGRTYEYLAALEGVNAPTHPPGSKSFTQALINALEQMLDEHGLEPFTTLQLQTAIHEQKLRKSVDSYGYLVQRRHNARRIALRPTPRVQRYFDDSRIVGHLNLRIELKELQLTEDQVEKLARKISKAVLDFNNEEPATLTRRIDFMGLNKRKLLLKNVIRHRIIGMSMRNGVQTLEQQKTLEAEVQEAPKPALEKPGLFAVVGWLTPRWHVYTKTIILPRPWSFLFVGTVLMATFTWMISGRKLLKTLPATLRRFLTYS